MCHRCKTDRYPKLLDFLKNKYILSACYTLCTGTGHLVSSFCCLVILFSLILSLFLQLYFHDVQEKKNIKEREKEDITNAQFDIPVTKNKTIKSGDMVKLDVKFCLNKCLIMGSDFFRM